MPTARDFTNSVRRPLEVAENAMLANNDAFAAVASIRAAQQAVAIAWMNSGGALGDPERKSKLDQIMNDLTYMVMADERRALDAAVQKIIDREEQAEAFEHPEEDAENGGMCLGEPRCDAAGDQRYRRHSEDCPAWAGLQIKYHREQIEQLEGQISDNALALKQE